MLSVWVFGFVIPWVVGIVFWKFDKTAIWISTPVAIAVSCVINMLGFAFDFWSSTPTTKPETVFALPVNIGLYPVTASISVYVLRKGVKAWLVVFLSSVWLTLLEAIAARLHYIRYGHGWNIGWSFVSYVMAVVIVVGYVRVLEFHNKTRLDS